MQRVLTPTLEKAKARLLSYVEKDASGCWLVNKGLTRQGYARIMVDYELDLAHRWSFRIFHGPIPEGKVVRHKCDVPNCANPDDLELGTQADNIRDCIARGRFVKNRGGAKLTWDQIDEIRASSEMQKVLAARYGVCRDTIRHIQSGRRWVR